MENALNILFSVTEKSGNLRNDLRKDILTSISDLRKSFSVMKNTIEEKDNVIRDLEGKIRKADEHANMIPRGETAASTHAAPSVGGMRSYSSTLQGNRPDVCIEKKYKLFVKSKLNESAETMKVILKRKVNPTELKVGIRSMKALRDGRLLIESGCKEEVEVLSKKN